jgi:integral membrane protein (TIGR01906 family)
MEPCGGSAVRAETTAVWRLVGAAVGRWATRAAAVLFGVSVPLALIGTNVRLLFGWEALYTFPITRYRVEEVSGIPRPELLRAARELRAYLLGPERPLVIAVTDDQGRVGPLFTERETVHMADVRRLVQRLLRVQEAAVLMCAGYAMVRLIVERRRGLTAVLRLVWWAGLGTNLAALALAGAALTRFDRLFTQFHVLSFRNDFWLLDPRTDHLVQMYPLPFWQLAAALFLGLTVVESALLAVAARWALARLETAAPSLAPVS